MGQYALLLIIIYSILFRERKTKDFSRVFYFKKKANTYTQQHGQYFWLKNAATIMLSVMGGKDSSSIIISVLSLKAPYEK